MLYRFVTHTTDTRHYVVKHYFSINVVKIRIKTEYGRITLKKIRIGYGYSVSCGMSENLCRTYLCIAATVVLTY